MNTNKKWIARHLLTLSLASFAMASPLRAAEGPNILQTPTVKVTEKSLEGNYDLHLYFGNTKPYLDSVQIESRPDGGIRGRMHVPDDFDAPLEKLAFNEASLRFEVLVPANNSRPQDMVFLYEAVVSPHDADNFAGHVTLTRVGLEQLAQPQYIGSFLLFKKTVP